MRKLAIPLAVLAILALWLTKPWTAFQAPPPGTPELGKGRAFESERTAIPLPPPEEEPARPALPNPGSWVSPPAYPVTSPSGLCWLPLQPSPPGPGEGVPPGLVLVAGNRYGIGIERAAAIELIEETGMRALASEFPRHKIVLEPFWHGATEVTNEQYAAFVTSTGAEPPLLWGQAAIDAAALAYAETVGQAKRRARQQACPSPSSRSSSRRTGGRTTGGPRRGRSPSTCSTTRWSTCPTSRPSPTRAGPACA